MKLRRVVVSGLGVVAPNGIGKDTFWRNLIDGVSAVRFVNAFDASAYPCKVAAEILDFVPERFMNPRRVRHRGRFSQLAVAAAKLAVADARINLTHNKPDRAMACLGTSLSGLGDVYETAREGFESKGVRGIPPTTGIEAAGHAAVSHVSAELALRGQAITIGSACATGLDALQWAYDRIRFGDADVVISGATDAPIFPSSFATMCALGVLTGFSGPPAKACRPYDLHRDGLVLGEGAAICVLEDLEHARLRNAQIYAELLGFGSGNEGAHMTRTDAAQLALSDAIERALASANLAPQAIDYINAHGNALPDYDLVETLAFKRTFGQSVYSIPVSSIKSMIGHAIAAASALQVVASCLTLYHSLLPPTINLTTPDPECDLDYVPLVSRVARVRSVLVNAHAIGGTHSVLVLGAAPNAA